MRLSKVERRERQYVHRMSIIIGVLDEHAPEITDIEDLAHHIAGALECSEEAVTW